MYEFLAVEGLQVCHLLAQSDVFDGHFQLVADADDGTAKGGVVIGIKSQLSMPVKWIGVGEGVEDLRPFNAEDFAKALFGN